MKYADVGGGRMSTQGVEPHPSEPQKKLQLEFSYLPLLGDLVLRYALLALWRFQLIPNWFFWVGQTVIVPVLIIGWIFQKQSVVKQKFNVNENQFEVKDSAHWIIAMLLLMIHAG